MDKSHCVIGVLFLSVTAFAQTSATLNAAPPASSNTTMPAPSPLTVLGVTGGANSASTGTAGQGSSPSIFTGSGGDATGAGSPATIGGAGGSFTVTTGNGGASGSGAGAMAVGANGGDVVFALGNAGSYTSTMGTAGRNGRVIFPNGIPSQPTICPANDPLNGLCFYWATNTVIGFSDGQGIVAGGLDDEGTRYALTGAVRFMNGNLTSGFDACLVDDGSASHTLAIASAATGTGNCGLPTANQHTGNLSLTSTSTACP